MERPYSTTVEKSATVGVHVSRSTEGFTARACMRRAGANTTGNALCGEASGRTPTAASASALEQLGRNLKLRAVHRKWARK